ncbi:MAG: hypothetical protein FJ295_07690 [Planctomycetes bacterium]|nr:hypothetical protein [Planctomycetota bacterium]
MSPQPPPPEFRPLPPAGSSPPEPAPQSAPPDTGWSLPQIVHEETVSDRAADERTAAQIVVDPRRVAIPRAAIYAFAAVLMLSIFGAAMIGYAVGRSGLRSAGHATEISQPCVVSGRVTYVNEAGETLPDAGASIIVLREGERPALEDKIQASGLRPADPPLDSRHAQIAKLNQFGGSHARSNAEGEFEVKLTQPGRYFLLVISKNGPRSAQVEPTRSEFAQMSRLIADPTELLGDRRFRWLNESIVGDRHFVWKLE